ncbi:MAG: AAA family ATPase [Rhodomicrobium sp.]
MLTRIEIDGFKTFDKFELNLRPFCSVVGPNASGKSNLFDALKLISALSQTDIHTAMKDLRGEPQELFRQTPLGVAQRMTFAIEVLLERTGADDFGGRFNIGATRLRYQLTISRRTGSEAGVEGLFVDYEECSQIKRADEKSDFLKNTKNILYGQQRPPFIKMRHNGIEFDAIEIRQDGPSKHGRPVALPIINATRTALSTITTSEFPHLYALKKFLASVHFLQIDPQAARRPSDRLDSRDLAPDASNLATVLARIQSETATAERQQGALSDIAADLASLIPSVRAIKVQDVERTREYAFDIVLDDNLTFSSRVVSDGTLRLLALLTILNDPKRAGLLCFEEPENGVHEGRILQLVRLLRNSCSMSIDDNNEPYFQIITNTHSPAVMQALEPTEIIAADVVANIDPQKKTKVLRTRMRNMLPGVSDSHKALTKPEISRLLKKNADAA